MSIKILTRNMHVPGLQEIGVAESLGAYQGLAKALRGYKPAEVVDAVKKSGSRTRRGRIPNGNEVGIRAQEHRQPVYLCVNADESEPGTFKDRLIIEKDPHQLLEGTIISAYALECHQAFIYIRGEFCYGAQVLDKAIQEAYGRGYLGKNILGSGFDVDLMVHRGAGAYICGEETALLESLEGKRGHPRLKPPFPAVVGLYGAPTVINNVETLANIPHIINQGPEWYASIGVSATRGLVFSASAAT
jgi:NADH-quinone oxidoreductase subunit F